MRGFLARRAARDREGWAWVESMIWSSRVDRRRSSQRKWQVASSRVRVTEDLGKVGVVPLR
jgi:hypothetical protein